MQLSTTNLARVSARHPWRTLGLWLLVIVLAGVLQATVGDSDDHDTDFTSNPESQQAETLMDERMGGDGPETETIVIRAAGATVDDPAFRAVVEQTTADVLALHGLVDTATNYYQAKDAGDPAAEGLVSDDRHTTIVEVAMVEELYTVSDPGPTFVSAAQGHRGNGFEVYAVGDLSSDGVYDDMAEEDLARSEQVGLPVALIVLVIVFGALIAAVLPVLLGLISIFVAFGLTAVAGRFIAVTDDVMIMITMIGLAVGIDYALFVIERYREERRRGHPKYDAIALAGGTAGKAVFFSGATVILALMGMFFISVTVFHSLAVGAILVVLVAVLAAQTFVPAMLGLLGDKINFPRRRRWYLRPLTRSRGFWGRVSRLVMARPRATLVIALLILIGAALPAMDLKTGLPGYESLPESDVKTGYQILNEEFYAGAIAPVEIVVDARADDPAVAQGVDNLVAALATDDFYGHPTITRSDAGDLTVVSVPMRADANSEPAFDAIAGLRDEMIPAAFGGLASHVYVGGESALIADINAMLENDTPKVFAFVLGLSFLLLMLAFRSIVVPLKAILMNLLSVGAAYGVLVAVFQKGYGSDLLDTGRSESIAAWIPIFLFCVLFGLSMDYHVFLLSRIREHFDQTGRNEESVAMGLQATGKVITGAALIMVAVFGAFAAGRLVDIEQMGLGLAVAIFLDATIVRSLLVPAAMKLLGNANWYMPRVLRWLPDLRIEGAPVASSAARAMESTPAD